MPKVPTKKADLVSLCEKLELDSEGIAKVLKSRLNEKLKPSTKLHTRVVKLDTELGRHLNKRSILSKSAWKDGLISSLVIVDNNLEKILKVELDYQGGDVSTKTVKINFPASVKSVELAVSSQEVNLLICQSHLSVLNSSFDHLAVIKLDVALTDICEVGSKCLFFQSNQIWSVSFDNLARGIFESTLVAGSGRGVEKDGSGRSSSFLDPSCISNYQ